MKKFVLITIFVGLPVLGFSKAPDHFYNDKKNLNPDPNYTPGDYAAPDPFKSKTIYQAKKEELANADDLSKKREFTMGIGEVKYVSMKNETAPVTGYFRNYFGVAVFDGKKPVSMEMLVDINSMDTAVPGRNNRILKIFFQSAKPKLGTSVIKFTEFKSIKDTVQAKGTIELNGVSRPISTELKVETKGGTRVIETVKPIELFISDFKYGKRPYRLMKECNHKALGNKVEVTTLLYLR